jgi:uncharacterized membrane protein YkvA (DUF1232 family)
MIENRKTERQALTPLQKSCRIISLILVVLAIIYVIMPYDYDKGLLGYIDDFFVFMAAFTFSRSCFQRSERKFIKHQLDMISLVFICLAICWLLLLAFTHIAK